MMNSKNSCKDKIISDPAEYYKKIYKIFYII